MASFCDFEGGSRRGSVTYDFDDRGVVGEEEVLSLRPSLDREIVGEDQLVPSQRGGPYQVSDFFICQKHIFFCQRGGHGRFGQGVNTPLILPPCNQ